MFRYVRIYTYLISFSNYFSEKLRHPHENKPVYSRHDGAYGSCGGWRGTSRRPVSLTGKRPPHERAGRKDPAAKPDLPRRPLQSGLRFRKLAVPQSAVSAAPPHKLVMAAGLDDTAPVHDADPVAVPHSAQPVREHYCRDAEAGRQRGNGLLGDG